MAYHETNWQKLKKLCREPRKYIGKIFPFLKSKLTPLWRDFLELLDHDKNSKPYPGHDALLEHITEKDGFFVQCGGNDGYFQDPTYYLEKFRGWTGIIVEPLPIGELCRRNRKKSTIVRSACVATDFPDTTASFVDCNAMSFIKGSIENSEEWVKSGEEAQSMICREITVPAQTIQSIIDSEAPGRPIDLFVADVEGYEFEILRGLDFSKNAPKKILVEAQNTERLGQISELLNANGYILWGEIGEKDYLFTPNI